MGLDVKASGEWQYYAPKQEEETRPRCLTCAELSEADARPAQTPHPTS
ncbi:hypothetical protein ACFQT0_28050 [Hymenobacter humi]|uniref:Uncharacterized protein n=1 Tax=Hymenobacter humi TaxID=1411620 RepID=A0ABW2UF10_9BACT